MSKIEELMILIASNDRLGFLKFRNVFIANYGSEKFKKLLKLVEKELYE